jgi:molybdopterin converting factor small subunit
VTASPPLKKWQNWILFDHITIELFSSLRHYAQGEKQLSMAWHAGMKVQDVIEFLKIPCTVELIALVNGRYSEPDKELVQGDSIILFPPIAGG